MESISKQDNETFKPRNHLSKWYCMPDRLRILIVWSVYHYPHIEDNFYVIFQEKMAPVQSDYRNNSSNVLKFNSHYNRKLARRYCLPFKDNFKSCRIEKEVETLNIFCLCVQMMIWKHNIETIRSVHQNFLSKLMTRQKMILDEKYIKVYCFDLFNSFLFLF